MYLLFLSSWAAEIEAKQLEDSKIQTYLAGPKVTKIEVLDAVGGV